MEGSAGRCARPVSANHCDGFSNGGGLHNQCYALKPVWSVLNLIYCQQKTSFLIMFTDKQDEPKPLAQHSTHTTPRTHARTLARTYSQFPSGFCKLLPPKTSFSYFPISVGYYYLELLRSTFLKYINNNTNSFHST